MFFTKKSSVLSKKQAKQLSPIEALKMVEEAASSLYMSLLVDDYQPTVQDEALLNKLQCSLWTNQMAVRGLIFRLEHASRSAKESPQNP